MPTFGPIKRRELIAAFHRLGFTGPHPGTKHDFMAKDDMRVRIPNPHHGDIGVELLKRLLTQAGISKQEWEQV